MGPAFTLLPPDAPQRGLGRPARFIETGSRQFCEYSQAAGKNNCFQSESGILIAALEKHIRIVWRIIMFCS
jgi:hypothetical protein